MENTSKKEPEAQTINSIQDLIPKNLQPDEKVQVVEAELSDERVVTDAQANIAAAALGVPLLTALELKALRDLGIHTGGIASIQISRGRVLVAQKQMDRFLQSLLKIAESSGDDQIAISASQTASSLFGKVIEGEKHVADLYQVDEKKTAPSKNRNRSFIPGQDAPLSLAVQINNNNAPKQEPQVVDVKP